MRIQDVQEIKIGTSDLKIPKTTIFGLFQNLHFQGRTLSTSKRGLTSL